MAKTKEEVKKTEKKAAFGKTGETLKFGVADLAAMLDIDPATARVKLRKAGVKKLSNNGASYGWNTKDDLKAVAEKLNAKTAPAAKSEKSTKKDDKPAKKDDKKADKPKASTEKSAPAKDAKKAANDKGAKKSGKKAA